MIVNFTNLQKLIPQRKKIQLFKVRKVEFSITVKKFDTKPTNLLKIKQSPGIGCGYPS